ncbi:MAG: hypothetical protein DRP12_03465, partial [Candidatus Aenigmatarchaeota archaeon]
FSKKLLNAISVEDINFYPDYQRFLKFLAKYEKIGEKNLLVTNGAEQAIDLATRCFFNRRVLLPSPGFWVWDMYLQKARVKRIYYKKTDSVFEFPLEESLNLLEQTEGIVICNPNSPLGSVINKKDLVALIEKAHESNVMIAVDEAYFGFYGFTVKNLIKKFERLLVIRTFSKYFALAGLRLGYVMASESVIKEMEKFRSPFNINSVAIKLAAFCLKNKKYFDRENALLLKKKRELENYLSGMGFKIYETHTNFILCYNEHFKSLMKRLEKNGVLVKDLLTWPYAGKRLKDFLRIGIPTPSDIDIFKHALRLSIRDDLYRITKRTYEKNAYKLKNIYENPAWRRLAESFLDLFISSLPGKKVLDLGCGTGIDSVYLAERGFRPVGIDFSEKMIKIAREKCRKRGLSGKFLCKDMCRVEFQKNAFDGVLANSSLLNLIREDVEKVVKKIYKWLAPKGVFGIIMKKGEGEEFKNNRLYTYYNLSTLKSLLKNAGFEVLEAYEKYSPSDRCSFVFGIGRKNAQARKKI